MTPFDDLTPDALHSYLTSTGWVEYAAPVGEGWRRYLHGEESIWVPQERFADYPLQVALALHTVAKVEGTRPTPAEQVAEAVREHGRERAGITCQTCDGSGGTSDLHPCPFAEEINGDDEPVCNCCEDCEHDCAMDI